MAKVIWTDNGFIVEYPSCTIYTEGQCGMTVIQYKNGCEYRADGTFTVLPEIAYKALDLIDDCDPEHGSLMDCVRFDKVIGLNQTC
jgi:hypothetical protein